MPTTTRSASISFAVRTSPGGIFVEGPDCPGVHAVSGEETLPLLQQALLLVREERIGAAEGDRSDGGEDRFVLVVARDAANSRARREQSDPSYPIRDSPVRPTLHSFGGDGTMTSGQGA